MKQLTPRPGADSLKVYLGEIGQYPVLTAEEEARLARMLLVDRSAAHRLVRANLRFVVKIAYEYRSYGFSLSDLIQEGNIGLVKAVQRFDPERGIRLITYAVWWIRAHIQNHILDSWSLVKLGTTRAQRKLFFSLARARRELERHHGEDGEAANDVSPARLAHALGVKAREVEEMSQRMGSRDLSLDAPTGEDGDAALVDLLSDGRAANDEVLSAEEQRSTLRGGVDSAVARLDRRERFIIEQRVLRSSPTPLKDLAEDLGISRERARQLEVRAKTKLRSSLLDTALEHGWPTGSRATRIAPAPGPSTSYGPPRRRVAS